MSFPQVPRTTDHDYFQQRKNLYGEHFYTLPEGYDVMGNVPPREESDK